MWNSRQPVWFLTICRFSVCRLLVSIGCRVLTNVCIPVIHLALLSVVTFVVRVRSEIVYGRFVVRTWVSSLALEYR